MSVNEKRKVLTYRTHYFGTPESVFYNNAIEILIEFSEKYGFMKSTKKLFEYVLHFLSPIFLYGLLAITALIYRN